MKNIEIMPGVVIGSEVYAPTKDVVAGMTKIQHGVPNGDAATPMFGTESYTFTSQCVKQPTLASMSGVDADTAVRPIIISDGQNTNIYLNSTTALGDPRYVNEICIFLDTINTGTINFYLGSGIDDTYTISVSSIIHAIEDVIAQKRATINTYAYGFCSVVETMIWTYGQQRYIGKYGAIRFGGGEWIRRMRDAFQPYIETYMEHCKYIKILEDDQVTDIVEKQKEIMYINDDGNIVAI